MSYPSHILQSDIWAKFRLRWGTKAVKVDKAIFTVHPIPHTSFNIGYMPKVFPQDINWKLLTEKAKEEKCIFVKIEPNSEKFNKPHGFDVRKGERMFAYATFLIDLKKSEEELLSSMHPKTRYNIRLAQRKGVIVKVGHTQKMFEEFLILFKETEKRHNFFNHPDNYYRTLFSIFSDSKMVEIATGYFEREPLASMMLLLYKDTLFYPYGGSTHLYKEKMAFNLVFWEAILLGKKRGCHYLDLWNCLAPEQETPDHPWYGFHRFKKGFGGELVRFCGAYDLVLNPYLYPLVLLANKLRWSALKLGSVLKKVIKR